jgi:hypothetical protein
MQIEMLIGSPITFLRIKTWLPRFENEPIDATQRSELADRIAKFLTANGHTVEVR